MRKLLLQGHYSAQLQLIDDQVVQLDETYTLLGFEQSGEIVVMGLSKVLNCHRKSDWSMITSINLMLAFVSVSYDLQTGIIFVQDAITVRGCLIFLVNVG